MAEVFLDSSVIINTIRNDSITALHELVNTNDTTIVTRTVLYEILGRGDHANVVAASFLATSGDVKRVYTPELPRKWKGGIKDAGEISISNFIAQMQAEGYIHNAIVVMNNTSDYKYFAGLPAVRTMTLEEYVSHLRSEGTLSQVGEYAFGEHYDFTKCFLGDTLIDMWPGVDGRPWRKRIDEIAPGDFVLSYDEHGDLKPGRVRRTFQNEAKIVLDFHGTFVTPGHVYYCAGGKYEGKFAPLLDILRDDGAILDAEGTMLRAATGCEVGSPDDEEFWAFLLHTDAAGQERVCDKAKLRLGTRWMLPGGEHFSMREYMDGIGAQLLPSGYVRMSDGVVAPFVWVLSDALPKPEEFVLARSATSLNEIYQATEWEGVRPSMPVPLVKESGPVQPLPASELYATPRNMPVAFENGSAPSRLLPERGTSLNRKQRRAAKAKRRGATVGVSTTVH